MSKQPSASPNSLDKEDAPADISGVASALHPDTFEVSTRLTLNLLKYDIQEIKNKIFRLDNKIDAVLAKNPPRHQCIFCEGNNEDGHRTTACPIFPDAIARSFRLRDLNKCISCLAPTHGNCSHKCRFCGGAHHAMLCSERSKSGPSQKRQKLEI
ncbi:hypothetical protein GCK32_007090 [Trichostrongylus colubriformis]|uniref:Uncharacterized protein n=1 Tax=Trichostrongylus colubriformis TaxID=6319 RepID=A0AAN8FCC6_TRICO